MTTVETVVTIASTVETRSLAAVTVATALIVCAVIDLSTEPEVMLTLELLVIVDCACTVLTPRSDNAVDASGLNPSTYKPY